MVSDGENAAATMSPALYMPVYFQGNIYHEWKLCGCHAELIRYRNLMNDLVINCDEDMPLFDIFS